VNDGLLPGCYSFFVEQGTEAVEKIADNFKKFGDVY